MSPRKSDFYRWFIALAAVCVSLVSLPAAATVTLVPRDCTTDGCSPPRADGFFFTQEYADGSRSPVQDFAAGRRSGQIQFALDGRALFVAIELAGSPDTCFPNEFPNAQSQQHEFDLVVDFGADQVPCGQLGGGTRKFHLNFDTLTAQPGGDTGPITATQFVGNNGTWVPAGPGQALDVQTFVRLDVTNGKRDFFLEFRIGLPATPGAGLSSIRLGTRFESLCHGGVYQFPNVEPNLDLSSSCTWEPIEFHRPTPVSLDVLAYNVGQMPWPIADGGLGEPVHFGFIAAQSEHVCFEETWTHNERREIMDIANLLHQMAGRGPMTAIGLPDGEDFTAALGNAAQNGVTAAAIFSFTGPAGAVIAATVVTGATLALGDWLGIGANGEDTGLLFLSSRPITLGRVIEYPHYLCKGEDCLEDKGFIHARVLLDSARKIRPGEGCNGTTCPPIPPPPVGLDADEFMDIFCTHLQNDTVMVGSQTEAAAVRDQQAAVLAANVTSLAAKDRPAFVTGDMNVNGNNLEEVKKLYTTFGIDTLTQFETLSVKHSDRYDLGIFEPHSTVDIALAAAQSPLGVPGLGTYLTKDDCSTVDPATKGRLDFFLVIPPRNFLGIPTFALEPGSFAVPVPFFPGNSIDLNDPNSDQTAPIDGVTMNPRATNFPVGGPVHATGPCLSDHAALLASAKLVRTIDPKKYNPLRPHQFTFTLDRLEGYGGDGCVFCGDPDFYGDLSGSRATVRNDTSLNQLLDPVHFGTYDGEKNVDPHVGYSWLDPGLASGAFTRTLIDISVFDEDFTSADDEVGIEGLTSPHGPGWEIDGLTGRATVKGISQDRVDCDLSDPNGPQGGCTWRYVKQGFPEGLAQPAALVTYTLLAVEQ